jgi:hypothetical protein
VRHHIGQIRLGTRLRGGPQRLAVARVFQAQVQPQASAALRTGVEVRACQHVIRAQTIADAARAWAPRSCRYREVSGRCWRAPRSRPARSATGQRRPIPRPTSPPTAVETQARSLLVARFRKPITATAGRTRMPAFADRPPSRPSTKYAPAATASRAAASAPRAAKRRSQPCTPVCTPECAAGGTAGASGAAMSLTEGSTGAINRYPRFGSVSMNRGSSHRRGAPAAASAWRYLRCCRNRRTYLRTTASAVDPPALRLRRAVPRALPEPGRAALAV